MKEFLKLNRKHKTTNKSKNLFLKTIICWLSDKYLEMLLLKCKLSGNYLGAAHQSCINHVNKADQHNFIPVIYHIFSKYDNHMIFNNLINSKNDKINLSGIPRTNEEFMCVKYGCVEVLDSMRFQQDSLKKLTELTKTIRTIFTLKDIFQITRCYLRKT